MFSNTNKHYDTAYDTVEVYDVHSILIILTMGDLFMHLMR